MPRTCGRCLSFKEHSLSRRALPSASMRHFGTAAWRPVRAPCLTCMWGWGAGGAHLHAAAGGTAAGALGRRGAGEGPVQLPTKAYESPLDPSRTRLKRSLRRRGAASSPGHAAARGEQRRARRQQHGARLGAGLTPLSHKDQRIIPEIRLERPHDVSTRDEHVVETF
jgi:hypothetical protein